MFLDNLYLLYSTHPVATITTAFVVIALLAIIITSQPDTPTPSLPGPPGWPIVGNLFQRGAEPAETYRQWAKTYGDVFKIRLGSKWVVVINSAEAGDELLSGSTYAAIFQSRPIVSRKL